MAATEEQQRVRDPFTPTTRQKQFFRACDEDGVDEILFSGSIRAGKTQAACKKLVAWAWRYGGRYLVGRKTYRELRDSTEMIFLRGEGGLPPACPPELVKEYRASDDAVFLKNGAEIMFRSLENDPKTRAKIRNISLNAIFIDQVEELEDEHDEELYEELIGRLSDPRGPSKVLLAANPGPIDHWVYRRFVDEETRKPQCRYVHVTLHDNEGNLDRKYFRSRLETEKTNPDYFKRFILGEWGAFGGKRFRAFDEQLHVIDPVRIEPWWEIMEGIDYGYAHPFCVVWVAITPQGRWIVFHEHYEKERSVSYHAQMIRRIRREYGIDPAVSWIDPSTTRSDRGFESVQMELSDQNIFTAKAENERIGGWARLDELLTNRLADGLPELQIVNTCTNLLRELPSAKLADDSEDIVKRSDHSIDALRYVVMSRPPIPREPAEEEPEDLRELYAQRLHDRATGREQGDVYLGAR